MRNFFKKWFQSGLFISGAALDVISLAIKCEPLFIIGSALMVAAIMVNPIIRNIK